MIKKIVLLVFLTITSLVASEVNWAKDYKSGIEKAKKTDKPVLFIYSRHTCKYCTILEETTLRDTRVVKALNKDYISIIAFSDDNDFIPREILRESRGTPAIWFLLPSGEPMYAPIPGAIGAEQFLEALAIVKTTFDKQKSVKK